MIGLKFFLARFTSMRGSLARKWHYPGARIHCRNNRILKNNMSRSEDYITAKVSFVIASLSVPVVVLPV